MQVPLLDLRAQYSPLKAEILEAVSELCDSQRFILGPKVEAFEQELAAYCQSGGAVGVTSGSDALIIALMVEGIKPGDEIITSPFTFFATVGAIVRCGATPVFADIDPVTFNIDPKKIAEKITPKTRGIIPVHLFGQAADMDHIMAAFALCMQKGETPDSNQVQHLVKALQDHITKNYYGCTNEILSGLGQMYVADERFKNNIDKHAVGTASFICQAITAYCRK